MRKRTFAVPFMILSILSILSVRLVLAGPVEDSKNAYRDGDYETAYRLIRPQAEKGDAGPSYSSASCMTKEKVSPRTTPRRRSGTEDRRNRGIKPPGATSI